MTERLVADQLVTLVTGIPSSALERLRGLGESFRHEKHIGRSDKFAPGGRAFNVLSTGGAKDSRRNGRIQQDYEIVVHYPFHEDEYEIDRVVHDDADTLMAYLSSPGQWGRPASTICYLFPEGRTLTPYSVDAVEGDGKLVGLSLTIAFVVEHTGQAIPVQE